MIYMVTNATHTCPVGPWLSNTKQTVINTPPLPSTHQRRTFLISSITNRHSSITSQPANDVRIMNQLAAAPSPYYINFDSSSSNGTCWVTKLISTTVPSPNTRLCHIPRMGWDAMMLIIWWKSQLNKTRTTYNKFIHQYKDELKSNS